MLTVLIGCLSVLVFFKRLITLCDLQRDANYRKVVFTKTCPNYIPITFENPIQ